MPAQTKTLPKQKKFYDIKVEALVPCLLTYRVYAEDEQSAITEISKKAPIAVKPNLGLKRIIKATVYNAGSSLIRFIKAFRV